MPQNLRVTQTLMLLLIALVHSTYAEKECSLSAASGNFYDLSPLIRTPQNGGDFGATDSNGGVTYVNICAKTTNVTCPRESNVCQFISGMPFSCGIYTDYNITETQSGVKIFCGGGDQCGRGSRVSEISITCKPGLKPGGVVGVITVTNCQWLINMESEYACPVSKGIDAGWIFVIILISGILLYLVVGTLYSKYKIDAWELPHKENWASTWSFVVDGFRFTKSKILGSNYEPIK